MGLRKSVAARKNPHVILDVAGMMKTKQQEEALFEAARNLFDPLAQRAFLDQACVDQPEMRVRIEKLLAAGTDAESFFKEAALFLSLNLAPNFNFISPNYPSTPPPS